MDQKFIESQCKGMKAAGKGNRAQQLWNAFCRRERNKQNQQKQVKGTHKGKGKGWQQVQNKGLQASWTNAGKVAKIQAKKMPRKPAGDLGKQRPNEPMHPPKRPAKPAAKPAGPVAAPSSSAGVKRPLPPLPPPATPPPATPPGPPGPPGPPAPVTPPEALAAAGPPQQPMVPPPGSAADGKGGWYLPQQNGWIDPGGVWHPFPGMHYSMFYHLNVCTVFFGIEVLKHVLSVRSEFGSCDGAHSFVLVLLVQVMFSESFELFIDA